MGSYIKAIRFTKEQIEFIERAVQHHNDRSKLKTDASKIIREGALDMARDIISAEGFTYLKKVEG